MIRNNVPLKDHNTFKVGGSARFFVEVKKAKDLEKVADFVNSNSLPYLVIGGGSNVLISDDGFSGLVLKMSTKKINWKDLGDKVEVEVDAGVPWDYFVSETVKRELYGLENLSGIPGTVGASPVQNIGAYGTEIKNTLVKVEVFNLESKKFKIFDLKSCEFGYRNSFFKKPESKNLIITKVFFLLKKEGEINLEYKDLKNYFQDKNKPSLKEVRDAVLEIRSKKFPDLKEFGTAGSFFKNPIITKEKLIELQDKFPNIPYFPTENGDFKISAAWILDNILNLKGKYFGQVGFFERQPLVVVNLGEASAEEIKKITEEMILKIKKELNINFEREVTLVGDFN